MIYGVWFGNYAMDGFKYTLRFNLPSKVLTRFLRLYKSITKA